MKNLIVIYYFSSKYTSIRAVATAKKKGPDPTLTSDILKKFAILNFLAAHEN
jgi:hypothetical protein